MTERTLSIYFALLCLCMPFIRSQAEPSVEVVQFEFQTLLLGKFDGSEGKGLYYQSGAEYLPASFILHGLGLRHHFSGTWPFRLYRRIETPDGIEMRAVAEISDAPPNAKEVFLAVLPSRKGDAIALRAISADENSLGAGELLLLNFSAETLAMHVSGGEVIQIASGSSGKIPYRIENEKFSFALKVAAKNEEGWRPVHSTMVTQVDGAALFAVAFPDETRKDQWQVRFLRNRRSPLR